jgi:hypothetical protein
MTRCLFRPGNGPSPAQQKTKPADGVRVLTLGFGGDGQREATPEQRQYLLEKVCRWYPHKTEAEAMEILHAMPAGERFRILMDRHERDDFSDPGDRYHEGGYREPPRGGLTDDGWGRA